MTSATWNDEAIEPAAEQMLAIIGERANSLFQEDFASVALLLGGSLC